jgi:hypothetical protein
VLNATFVLVCIILYAFLLFRPIFLQVHAERVAGTLEDAGALAFKAVLEGEKKGK